MGAQFELDQELNHCTTCEAPLKYCECDEDITTLSSQD